MVPPGEDALRRFGLSLVDAAEALLDLQSAADLTTSTAADRRTGGQACASMSSLHVLSLNLDISVPMDP